MSAWAKLGELLLKLLAALGLVHIGKKLERGDEAEDSLKTVRDVADRQRDPAERDRVREKYRR